ncbi:hypothetical protein K438DRAFT_1763510 [Mycena galopus ATCC 62051]|nr:hypothetical protein K438DRAFT_1763510 [Mycena galopus ATCC 62051]
MEGVSAAIKTLQKVASTSKDNAVNDAVEQLGSILRLLQLSSPSTRVHASLCKTFYEKLGTLYFAFLREMCGFCKAVLEAILHEKVKPAFEAGDIGTQNLWENVQKAVVSSIFDFLEQNGSKSNKGLAAEILYPTLCAMFYPPKPQLEWTSPSLIFNVNLFLSETAANHPDNQSRLRSENVLGPTRIGRILSQSKDFFILDSLLGVFGVLLPAREVQAKRTNFVDTVFKPKLFSRSAEIKKLIAASSGKDWDPVSVEIIAELAESDLSFPQPFYISNLRTNPPTPTPNVNDVFYVDNKGLFANMDLDEVYTPWQVSFPSMERIKIGVPGTPSTSVSMQLTAPPVIGPSSEAEDQKQKKKCTMEFQLKNADAGRFLDTLKARGLSKLVADTKVSKTVEASMSVIGRKGRESGARLVTSKYGVNNALTVGTVWQSGQPTSPLVSDRSKTPNRKHDSSSSANSDLPDASSKHEKRTIESDDEVEPTQSSPPSSHSKDQDFEPTQPPQVDPVAVPARVTRGAVKKKPALTTAAEEAAASKPAAPGRAKASAAVAAAVLDEEDEDVDVADVPPPGRSIRRQTGSKSAAIDKELSMSEDEIEAADENPPTKAQETSATTKKSSNGKADSIAAKVKAEIASKRAEPKSGPKRPKVDGEEVPDSEEEEAEPPTKRLRGRQNDTAREDELEPVPPTRRVSAAVFGTAIHAPAKKRYGGKKGRTSSPAPDAAAAADDTDMAIDYDELPTAPSPPPSPVAEKARKAVKPKPEPKTVSGVNDARKSRVAAMRGKGGKKPAAAKAPPKPTKAPPKPTKAGPSGKNKKTQAAAAEENADPESDHEVKPPRRSTRTTKPAEPIVEATTSKPKPKTKTEKPRKAPWEDIHLQKDNDVAMTDEPLPQNDDMAMQDEPQAGSNAFEEYYIPLKACILSGSIDPPVPQDDVPMLDDTSPKATGKTVQLEKAPPLPAIPSARPLDSTSVFQVDSTSAFTTDPVSVPAKTSALTVDSASAVPAQSTSALARHATNSVPTVKTKSQAVVDLTSPIRPQSLSPVARALPPPMMKFKSDVPSRSMKPVSFLQKAASPSPPPTPPKPVHMKKSPPPLPVHQRQSPRSPSPSAHHKFVNDSPFPERVYQTVTFEPARASTPSLQRNARSIPARRTANNHATFGRALYKHEADGKDHDYRRSRSPMQGIIEVLNEIQAVVVEKITQRFDHVKTDVRIGRDTILRGATVNLEAIESHFNTLVDLEEEYAAYHRKIISGIDDMQKSAEVFSNALGQIVQHHDRRSLSKKLPPTLFTLPLTLRKPVVLL